MEATETVAGERGTVTLQVSNQSFAHDPVGIRISIDGGIVVDDDFSVDSQDNWSSFEHVVPPGDHELVMNSSTGTTQTEVLNVPAGGRRWVAVSYWFDPRSAAREAGRPGAGAFTVAVADQPTAFA